MKLDPDPLTVPEEEPDPEAPEWSRLVALVCAAALLLIVLYLGSGNRG